MRAICPARINWLVVSTTLLILVGGAFYIGNLIPNGKPWLYLLGGAMGISLYHAAFGFTAGWRNLVNDGRGANMRAQMFAFAIAAVLFLPALDAGEILNHGVGPAAAPIGIDAAWCFYFRFWHAAWWRVRIRHTLHRWRRFNPHGNNTGVFCCRVGHRQCSSAMVAYNMAHETWNNAR